jgi:hypothetical protein
MQSIWDYLRLRTRDSVLAGMQEAFEAVGGADGAEADHAAARRLLEGRTTAPAELAAPAAGEPAPAAAPRRTAAVPGEAEPDATLAERVRDRMVEDTQPADVFERRIQEANAGLAGNPAPRKRGRPRKNP